MEQDVRTTLLDEQEIEALKMTQDVIKRMADNSQSMKNYFLLFSGVVATIISGITITPIKTLTIGYIIIGIAFWYMDAKYLKLERLFIEHHKAIINGSISYFQKFELNISRYKSKNTIQIMFSSFSVLMYPIIIVAISLMLWFL